MIDRLRLREFAAVLALQQGLYAAMALAITAVEDRANLLADSESAGFSPERTSLDLPDVRVVEEFV